MKNPLLWALAIMMVAHKAVDLVFAANLILDTGKFFINYSPNQPPQYLTPAPPPNQAPPDTHT